MFFGLCRLNLYVCAAVVVVAASLGWRRRRRFVAVSFVFVVVFVVVVVGAVVVCLGTAVRVVQLLKLEGTGGRFLTVLSRPGFFEIGRHQSVTVIALALRHRWPGGRLKSFFVFGRPLCGHLP